MENAQPSLVTRDDTFFGVCQGLGEDFGFSPQYLRIALALLLFWNPLAAVAAYAAAGLVVLLTRTLAPEPRRALADEPVGDSPAVTAEAAAEQAPERSDDGADLAIAA